MGDNAIIIGYFAQKTDYLCFIADNTDDLVRPGHVKTCPDVPGRASRIAAVIYIRIFHWRVITYRVKKSIIVIRVTGQRGDFFSISGEKSDDKDA